MKADTKPQTYCSSLDPLPPALLALTAEKRWVVWKWQWVVNGKGGKWTKPPFNCANPQSKAKNNDKRTWDNFATASATYKRNAADGIGFMLLDSDKAALDLDDCRNPDTKEISEWARAFVDKANALGAYVEVTVSGTGLRIIGEGKGAKVHRKFKAGESSVEIYRACERYITISGVEIGAACTKLPNIDGLIDETLGHYGQTAAAANNDVEAPEQYGGDDYIELLQSGTSAGVVPKHRGRAFFAVVLYYARAGRTAAEIDLLMREHPNGIAAKYLRPTDRLKREIERIFSKEVSGVSLEDFNAYMPAHNYIYTPSREPWPASSVNARLGSVPLFDAKGEPVVNDKGDQVEIAASLWLDRNRPVEQMTWAPGLPLLIRDRLISDGGWIDRPKVTCLNLYRPPTIKLGNAAKAKPWLKHIIRVFGKASAKHIVRWLAHRVQRPQDKINHALVLGGAQGIGKDTMLEPIKYMVGPWNFSEVSPHHMLGRFNGFLKSVILRVSEARDLGDVNRYQFYDHMKSYTAAPPDVLRVDEKYLREHAILNCCGVIITTNHKADGIYLPADDRRHYVAWSELTKSEFSKDYWNRLWSWYANGGNGHVGAYLAKLDLTGFDPKAPPTQTEAFWDIVNANRAPEDSELADALDRLKNPDAVTIDMIAKASDNGNLHDDFFFWITDRKNRRTIPHRFESCGYVPVRNDAATDGYFVVGGRRQPVYAKAGLSVSERLKAANELAKAKSV